MGVRKKTTSQLSYLVNDRTLIPGDVDGDVVTVTDDGTLLMLPPVGDTVRRALVQLSELVRISGAEQVGGMVMIALSNIAAVLDQESRNLFKRSLLEEVMAAALDNVGFAYVPDVSNERDTIPKGTEWHANQIVTFVEDDSNPERKNVPVPKQRGICAGLVVESSLFAFYEDSGQQVLPISDSSTPPVKARAPRTVTLPDVLHFKNDNINRAAVRAFSVSSTWKRVGGLYRGATQQYKGLTVSVGLPETEVAERIWESLSKGGARMVKAHYALWARWYEGGGEAGDYVSVSVNQFCADIGYTKHHKGGFRREHKEESMRLLEALTTVQINADYQIPGGDAKRLRGGLWARGMIGEQKAVDENGAPSTWEAVAFTFAPGPWFTHPVWARHNKFVGKIGVGLLRLDNREEWAIVIGGYLGTLMRTNAYQVLRVRANTILHRTGLAQSEDLKRRAAQMLQKFESAMDQLVAVKVITSWTWPNVDTTEINDIDDPDAVAEYYAEENLPKTDWRNQIVEIVLPFDQESDQLLEKRSVAAKKATRFKGKKSTEKQE